MWGSTRLKAPPGLGVHGSLRRSSLNFFFPAIYVQAGFATLGIKGYEVHSGVMILEDLEFRVGY